MYALYYREQHGLLVTGEQLALDEINKLGKPRFGMLWYYIYIYMCLCVCTYAYVYAIYIYICMYLVYVHTFHHPEHGNRLALEPHDSHMFGVRIWVLKRVLLYHYQLLGICLSGRYPYPRFP